VADDEQDVGLIVSERLRRNGHEVDYASDGNEAVAMVEAAVYDLLILDIHMSGRTGYTVCQYSKSSERNGKTPVLLISAFPEERAKWREGKADAFLAKPFETGRLTAEVERLINKTA
jgi:two-component system response regulator TctD